MLATRRVLIVGVGGQGVVLAGNILADVALAAGLDVKKSEVHGMSKRGGIVFSHVPYGPAVHSPLIRAGEADALVAFEWAEGLRWRSYLRADGIFICGTTQIVPPAAHLDHQTWTRSYPGFDRAVLGDHGGPAQAVDAVAVARRAGAVHVANTVLLGVLSVHPEFSQDAWEETIARHVPARTVEMNVRAFREGAPSTRRLPRCPHRGRRPERRDTPVRSASSRSCRRGARVAAFACASARKPTCASTTASSSRWSTRPPAPGAGCASCSARISRLLRTRTPRRRSRRLR
jgi:indolepyruvate ferredoxin oxidoreductase beta subunit